MTAHTMTMTDQGDGTWKCECPTCGRVLILSPGKHPVIDVLIQGDPEAAHTGGTGGLVISEPRIAEHRLEPFAAWAEANL